MPIATSTLSITPIGAGFAAHVEGVRLSHAEGLGPDLRHALATYKVLVFPGQHLSPDELVRAGRLFGPLTPAHPVLPPLDRDHPEVLEIDATRSRLDARYRDEWENDTWHTDVSFMPDPPLGSLLHGVVIPPVGGDTAFADLQGAYDALSAPLRRLVDDLEATHDGRAEFAAFLHDLPEGGRWSGGRFTVLEPVTHPVVREHPDTGRRGLFVNPTFTTRLVGLPKAESDALLQLLYERTTTPEHTYRHRWSTGDVVAWDNRATLHVGVRDFGDAHRVLHRVTIAGDRPLRTPPAGGAGRRYHRGRGLTSEGPDERTRRPVVPEPAPVPQGWAGPSAAPAAATWRSASTADSRWWSPAPATARRRCSARRSMRTAWRRTGSTPGCWPASEIATLATCWSGCRRR